MSYPVDEFFVDEFSIAATWNPGGGVAASTIKVSEERIDVNNDALGSQFSNVGLKVYARTVDVSTATIGTSTITYNGVTYNVANVFHDGEGMTTLYLSRD